MTNGELLLAKIALARPAVAAATERLWGSHALRGLYPEYLCTMHQVVRATVPLMRVGLARCAELAAVDEVAAAMVGYLEHHIPEEAGHDEWVLQDLEAIGRDRGAALTCMPSAAVASLVGAQYYWIEHAHPVALIGHMAVMEGSPPSPRLPDLIADRTGYPPAAFRSLRRHAVHDVRHRDDLLLLIDRLPLTSAHHELAGVSALHTLAMLARLFEQVAASAPAGVP